jgi:hypothetical protein
MASLKEYFDRDFPYILNCRQSLQLKGTAGNAEVEIVAKLHLDFDSNAKFVSYFVPPTDDLIEVCASLIRNPEWAMRLGDAVSIQSGFVGEQPSSSGDLKFSGRVFIYTERQLSEADQDCLGAIAASAGMSVRLRGPGYAKQRSSLEKPRAFISHDSRNGKDIAQPLAIQLTRMMCPVWFDEFSLRVGQSLRETIEKGLRECQKCILVLTPEFLSNEGWTKREFNSVFTREVLTQENVILPVWHNVSAREVYSYSPSLADKVAVDWCLGVEEVARRLYREMIPKTGSQSE